MFKHIKQLLKENEQRIATLYEEGGVGAFKNSEDIDSIVGYCEDYIKNNPKNLANGWYFKLTQGKEFETTLFRSLTIYVVITDEGTSGINDTGSGSISLVDTMTAIWYGGRKNHPLILKLYGASNGSMLYKRSLSNTLYHEFNHAIENNSRYDINDLRKSDGIYRQAVTLTNVRDVSFHSRPIVNEVVHAIVYRLFSETERNALIASVYGDLSGLDSEYIKWKDDIKRTQAYHLYKLIKINIEAVDTWLTERDWGKLKENIEGTEIFKDKTGNAMAFRHAFWMKTERMLEVLYRGIFRAASVYYDSKEDRQRAYAEKSITEYFNKYPERKKMIEEFFRYNKTRCDIIPITEKF